ncbi:MAG TPA: hypothetical protein VKU41_32625 [Polyangiaceae bacterium]|nr:hypothetical protein [Polyangiaceae bacterium]
MTGRPRTLMVLAAIGVATSGAASCNVIVGAGDYVVDAAAADGSGAEASGDAAGSAAADGPDDRSTQESSSPSKDGGGPREAAAEASMVEASLPDAPADAPMMIVVPEAGLTDVQQLVASCVYSVSCDPFFFATTISDCIAQDYLQATPALSCLATIDGCAAFTACRHVSYATLAECPGTGAAAHCDAATNRAINCLDQANGTVRDCAKLGGTCATYADSTGTMVADCMVVPSCTETDTLLHCSGDSVYQCINGSGFGEHCSATSSTCATVGGDTNCYLNAAACNAPGYACSGSTLDWCTSGGQRFTLDCARAGLSCETDDAGNGDCVSTTASPSCTDACAADGKTIVACVGGAAMNIDCTQYGFTQCTTATDNSGTLYAYCQ